MIEDYSIRNEFSVYDAKRFIDSISAEKVYVFIGKTSEWADESDPPTPTASEQQMINTWDNMIITKRLNSTNLSLGAVKNVWESGTIYQPWDSEDGLLYNKKFFVITSDNRVYKCLDCIPNTPSTIEPTDTGVTPVRLSDGYTWKFMYDISAAELAKFNDTECIPVKFLTEPDASLQWQVQLYAIPGTINRIEVMNGGSGYTSTPSVTITGNGTGATATAVMSGDTVSYIVITNPGQGYTWANVTITGNGSVSATGRAIISPIKGHGSNAVEELYGGNVISSVTFDGDEAGKFPVNIKFRQIGLIANPTMNGSSTIADLTGVNIQYTTLNVTGMSGIMLEGEYLDNITTGLNRVAQVIKIESNKIYVNMLKGPISANDNLQGSSSGTSCEVLTVVPHILENYSGELLYVENRSPITKIPNQSETYRLIIKF